MGHDIGLRQAGVAPQGAGLFQHAGREIHAVQPFGQRGQDRRAQPGAAAQVQGVAKPARRQPPQAVGQHLRRTVAQGFHQMLVKAVRIAVEQLLDVGGRRGFGRVFGLLQAGQLEVDERVVGTQGQGLLQAVQGPLRPSQVPHQGAQVHPGGDKAVVQGEGLFPGLGRFDGALQRHQRQASPMVRHRLLNAPRQCLIQGFQGLRVLLQFQQRDPQVMPGLGVVGLRREGGAQRFHRLGRTPQVQPGGRQVHQRRGPSGQRFQRRQEQRFGLGQPPGFKGLNAGDELGARALEGLGVHGFSHAGRAFHAVQADDALRELMAMPPTISRKAAAW